MTARLAGLVLAAGAGRRLGRRKHDLVVDGTPLLVRAVGALRAGGCGPVLVVTQPGDRLAPDVEAAAVVNPVWAAGMGSSLRRGLDAAAAAGAAAAVVTLVDTPAVGAEHVRRLVAAAGGRAAAATYRGRRRTPVLLPRAVWDDVASLAVGDVGARGWLDAHPDAVVAVDCTDLGDWVDVDLPADLASGGTS